MKKWIMLAVLLVVIATVIGFVRKDKQENGKTGFQTIAVERGDLENTVSSTGTLNAIGTVEVGTQVSGTVEKVLVDFNDTVKKGDLVAILDKRVLQASVSDAEANLIKTRAQLELAETELKRVERLYNDDMISDQEYVSAKTSAQTARASVMSATTSLDRARTNLNYAEIRSPIDGTIIQRAVEPGQTVAASFSTPTLFIIASDLQKMEIEAMVDESDIGLIKDEQMVRFTVEAYPDNTFEGIVRQIRLQPETVNNVVNYTVIVDAENPEGKLLPGMTATVDFIAERIENALLVPNSALRFKPDEAMMAAFRERMQERMKEMKERGDSPENGQNTDRPGGGMGRNASPDAKTVWTLDENEQPVPVRFEAGATDGKFTEVKRSRRLEAGTKVIISVSKSAESNGSSQSGPYRRRLL